MREGAKNSRRLTLARILQFAPGPSPWYCRNPVPSPQGPLKWVRSEVRSHISLLVDLNNRAYLALPFYVWFQELDDGRMLLWRQRNSNDRDVLVDIVHLNHLKPLDMLDDWLRQTPEPDGPLYSTSQQLKDVLRFNPALEAGTHRVTFPLSFVDVPEFFVIAENVTLPTMQDRARCCVYAVEGKAGTIDVYPQDWFNQGSIDIGYQWITQIARDPATGRLIGGGIRIDGFVLDETGRKIDSQF